MTAAVEVPKRRALRKGSRIPCFQDDLDSLDSAPPRLLPNRRRKTARDPVDQIERNLSKPAGALNEEHSGTLCLDCGDWRSATGPGAAAS